MWFDDGERGLLKFCEDMKQEGTWGTELTLKADALGFKLHLL